MRRSMPSSWQRKGYHVILWHGAEMAVLEVVQKEPEALQWTTDFPSTERNEQLSLAGINLSLGTGRAA